MAENKKGICLECGEPLQNPNAIGYHSDCSTIAHARAQQKADEEYPFIVIGHDGSELDRFSTEYEANDYLLNIHHAHIEKV